VGRQTGIARAHHTRSPWWVYAAVSPACQHCHAAACAARVARRMGLGHGRAAPRVAARRHPLARVAALGRRRRVPSNGCAARGRYGVIRQRHRRGGAGAGLRRRDRVMASETCQAV